MGILRDILGKTYGMYWVKTMGYIGQTLWDILYYWIYLSKAMENIEKKQWGILGKTMEYIMEYI